MRWRAVSKRLFELGLIIFALLLPLEIVPNRVISILSLITTILLGQYAATQLYTNQRARVKASWLLALILVLPLLVTWLSAAHAHLTAGQSGVRTLAILVARAWIIAAFANDRHLKLFAKVTIVVGLAVASFGYYQYIGDLVGLSQHYTFLRPTYSSHGSYHFPRVHSLAREPLLLANYLFIPIALLLMYALRKPGAWAMTALAYLILLLCLLNSRGALIALAAVLLAVAYSQRRHLGRLVRPSLVILSGIIVALVVLAALSLARPGYAVSFLRHASELGDASFRNRTNIWPTGVWAVGHHPLLGVGPGQAGQTIASHNRLTYESVLVFNNTYVTWFTELGLLGLAAFLPLLWRLMRFVTSSLQQALSAPHAAYALVLIAYTVQISTYEAGLNLRFWAVVGLSLAAFRLDKVGREGSPKSILKL